MAAISTRFLEKKTRIPRKFLWNPLNKNNRIPGIHSHRAFLLSEFPNRRRGCGNGPESWATTSRASWASRESRESRARSVNHMAFHGPSLGPANYTPALDVLYRVCFFNAFPQFLSLECLFTEFYRDFSGFVPNLIGNLRAPPPPQHQCRAGELFIGLDFPKPDRGRC